MQPTSSTGVIPASAPAGLSGLLGVNAIGMAPLQSNPLTAATPTSPAPTSGGLTPNVNAQITPVANAQTSAPDTTLAGGSTTTTSTAPSWQVPYEQNAINQAQAQYNSITSPQQLVAPFSTQQNEAISGITNAATNGTPEENAAQSYVTNVLSGNPANNPYLNSEFTTGAQQVQNQLESEFAGSGANVLSSLPVQSDELNNLASQLYGGAYSTGVQQQESAASLAPTLDTQQYTDLSNLYNAGGQVQSLAQQYITAPQQFLQNYLQQMMTGTGQTSTTAQNPSTLQDIATGLTLGSDAGTAASALATALQNYLSS